MWLMVAALSFEPKLDLSWQIFHLHQEIDYNCMTQFVMISCAVNV